MLAAEIARFDEARRKEVAVTEDMGTCEEWDEKNLPKDSNVMGSRLILTDKHAGTAQEMAKTRLVSRQTRTDRKLTW